MKKSQPELKEKQENRARDIRKIIQTIASQDKSIAQMHLSEDDFIKYLP
jgi:hypothetical protein